MTKDFIAAAGGCAAILLCSLFATTAAWAAQPPTVTRIPLVRGVMLVSALHSPAGDRENLVVVERASASGVAYSWQGTQQSVDGSVERNHFSRFVRAADLATAPRLHTVYWTGDRTDYPGYTTWSISTAVYDQLLASGSAPYTIVDLGSDFGPFSAAMRSTLKLKGTLTAVTRKPEPFPLLVNAQRVSVPALHLHGQFVAGERARQLDMWVLADRAHPLLLKSNNQGDVLQMVRVSVPGEVASLMIGRSDGDGQMGTAATGTGVEKMFSLENQLDSQCRAELPDIYFEFGTAELSRQSAQGLAATARIISDHGEWTFSIEGHTDDIGTTAANQKLSEARAAAVRASLIANHGISASRLAAVGYGESRPRETNATLEGRARNRRVELVRPCTPNEK